ncbi:MAG TPA: MFS transporter [Gaiellaceae bacterium]|jgi:MFS family permease|nr:MFS transporter [Gaiellaceae bacterium]
MLHGSIWRHRDLRLMIPARAISTFGDDMALLVLTLRVFSDGRGPWSITLLLLCATVPVVALAPIAGRLVDSMPFRTLATSAALWQAACCVALALAGPLWAVYALVVALQVGHVVANPAWQALMPEIAQGDELGRAVGVSQTLSTIGSVAAPAVAGVLVGLLGYGAPLLVDAGTFLVLAAAALAIRTRRSHEHPGGAEAPTVPAETFSLRSDVLLWPLLLGLCALVLVGEVTNVVEVFLLRGTLGAGNVTFGLVAAALAAGIVVGSVLAGRPAADPVRARRLAVAALVLGVTIGLAGLAPAIWAFAAAWAFLGVSNGYANVDGTTLVLGRTPDFCRGRVLATVNAMIRGSSLVAMVLGGLAGTLLGPRTTFVVAGALMAVVAIVLLIRITRTLSADSARRVSTPSGHPTATGRPA